MYNLFPPARLKLKASGPCDDALVCLLVFHIWLWGSPCFPFWDAAIKPLLTEFRKHNGLPHCFWLKARPTESACWWPPPPPVCVLLPVDSRCETGQSSAVLSKALSLLRPVPPVETQHEPAVQRGVWGLGPHASSLLLQRGEYEENSRQDTVEVFRL